MKESSCPAPRAYQLWQICFWQSLRMALFWIMGVLNRDKLTE